jgi:hypothetical protein
MGRLEAALVTLFGTTNTSKQTTSGEFGHPCDQGANTIPAELPAWCLLSTHCGRSAFTLWQHPGAKPSRQARYDGKLRSVPSRP